MDLGGRKDNGFGGKTLKSFSNILLESVDLKIISTSVFSEIMRHSQITKLYSTLIDFNINLLIITTFTLSDRAQHGVVDQIRT